jgi:RimJ/RimL family protein N-acetyltransferase
MSRANVMLVSLTTAHAEAMYRWMCDPEVAMNLGIRSEPSLEKTRAFIERAANDTTIQARAILLDDKHVGNVVLDQIDGQARKARLHIYVGEAAARGRGVGKHAVGGALELAFDELSLNKVWLTVHTRNARAIAAYVAVGFRVEGVHREEFVIGEDLVDELYMGCLAADFARERGKDA